MSICPNKSHPDWKALEKAWGKTRALQMYIDNNYEIPSVGSNDTSVGTEYGKNTYTPKSTFALLRDYPSVTRELVDLQKRLDPSAKIVDSFIFNKDGSYAKIQPGQPGAQHRNAFEALVTWANNKEGTVPPYEYIEEIAEMYSSDPNIQEQIKRFGNVQDFATALKRYSQGEKVSNSFKEYAPKFWNKFKALYGNPDANFILTDAFRKDANKATLTKGPLATTKFQKEGVRVRYNNGYDTSGLKKKGIKLPSVKDAANKAIRTTIAANWITEKENWEKFSFEIRDMINDFKDRHTSDSGGVRSYKGSINEVYLDELASYLNKEGNVMKYISAVSNDTDLPTDTTADGKETFTNLIGQMQNANQYKEVTQNSLILEDGTYVDGNEAGVEVKEEIDDTKTKRDKLYEKIKFKPMRKFLRKVEKWMQYQTNSRLDAKYLSGSEQSLLSKISYQSLFWGENMRNKNILDFNKKLMEDTFDKKYDKWSYYKNKDRSIGELTTETFKGDLENGNKDVDIPLTKAEMLSVYLMGRQDRARIPMMKFGIYLNDNIDGRNLPVNQTIKFKQKTLEDIAQKVIDDPELMKVVENIDNAMGFMSEKVSKTFSKLNGIDLRMEDNYFPMYGGKKSFDMRKGKSAIEDWKSLHTSRGEHKAIRIVDPIQVVNSYKATAASYASLALPIRNLKLVLKGLEADYVGTQEENYINALKDIANRLEDTSLLYSSQGEQEFAKALNKLTSNFAVAVLGMNVPVMLKQSVSFITALEEVDGQYLKQAGFGTKFFPVINPKQVLDAIEYTGTKKGSTVLPIEWNLNTDEGIYKRMKELSPMIEVRLEGMITREMGEAMMNMDDNNDIITLPWKRKDGSKYKISKARLMEGIRVFDAVTIANIWRALEYEAEGKYGLKRGTAQFDEHVAIRAEEVISKTQPDWNMTNRSTAALSQNPILKFFTMFSSATSKIAMLQIDGILNYIANPTKSNKMKMIKRSANIMVTTAATIAAMDMLKGMLLYGWDDDDELFKDAGIATAVNSMSMFYGIGQIARVVGSQLDNKPFFQKLQHPGNLLMQDVAEGIANLAKGNLLDASKKGIEATFKISGMPTFPLITVRQGIKRSLGSE